MSVGAQKATGLVVVRELRLLSDPATNGNLISTLPFGTVVEISSRSGHETQIGAESHAWYRVSIQNLQGCVYAGYISVEFKDAPDAIVWLQIKTLNSSRSFDVARFDKKEKKATHFLVQATIPLGISAGARYIAFDRADQGPVRHVLIYNAQSGEKIFEDSYVRTNNTIKGRLRWDGEKIEIPAFVEKRSSCLRWESRIFENGKVTSTGQSGGATETGGVCS